VHIAIPRTGDPRAGCRCSSSTSSSSDRAPAGKCQVGGVLDGPVNAPVDSEDEDRRQTIVRRRWLLPWLENMVSGLQGYPACDPSSPQPPRRTAPTANIAAAEDFIRGPLFLAGIYFGAPAVNAALCSGDKAADASSPATDHRGISSDGRGSGLMSRPTGDQSSIAR